MGLVKLFRLRLVSGPKADPNEIYIELEEEPKILDRRAVIRTLGKELRKPIEIAVSDTSYLLDRMQEKLSELGFECYVVEDRVTASALIRIHDLRDRIERGELDAPEDMIAASQKGVDGLKKAVKKKREVPLKLITAIAAGVAFISVGGLVADLLLKRDVAMGWEANSMAEALGGSFPRGGGTVLEIGMSADGALGEWDDEEDEEDIQGDGVAGGGGDSAGMDPGMRRSGKRRSIRLDVGVSPGGSPRQARSSVMDIILVVAAGVLGLMLSLLLGQYILGMPPPRRKRAMIVGIAIGAVIMVSASVALGLAMSSSNEKVEALRKKIMAKRKELVEQAKAEHRAMLRRAAARRGEKKGKKKKRKKKGPVKKLCPFATFMEGLPEVQKEQPKAAEFDRELLPFTAMMEKMRKQRRAMVKDLDGAEEAAEGEGASLAVDTVAEGGKDTPAPGATGGGASPGDAGAVAATGAPGPDAGLKKGDLGEPSNQIAGGKAGGKIAGGAGAAPPAKKPKMPKVASKGLKDQEVKGKEVLRLKGSGGQAAKGKKAAAKPPPLPRMPKIRLPAMPEIKRPPTKMAPLAMASLSFSGGFLGGILLFFIALVRASRKEDIFKGVD